MTTKTAKRCEICGIRPIDKDVKATSGFDYCYPCDTLAGMENGHSDNAHEGIETITVKSSNFRTKAALEAWRESERQVMEKCWVCHPELDQTKVDYVAKVGTSREGMVMNVPVRASGKEKADVVVAIFTERKLGEAKVTVSKGTVTFRSGACQIQWNARGQYLGATITREGKTRKVRNVSEMLKLAAALV